MEILDWLLTLRCFFQHHHSPCRRLRALAVQVPAVSCGQGRQKIVEYEDLSDEGIEGTGKAKSVSSVSFSKDNSKLMMVGRDGVVIIRNTHLCE